VVAVVVQDQIQALQADLVVVLVEAMADQVVLPQAVMQAAMLQPQVCFNMVAVAVDKPQQAQTVKHWLLLVKAAMALPAHSMAHQLCMLPVAVVEQVKDHFTLWVPLADLPMWAA
jgi:tagatose-1,6-bisphosphate aldolase non-catalytic subunit AgaZ/GatZ